MEPDGAAGTVTDGEWAGMIPTGAPDGVAGTVPDGAVAGMVPAGAGVSVGVIGADIPGTITIVHTTITIPEGPMPTPIPGDIITGATSPVQAEEIHLPTEILLQTGDRTGTVLMWEQTEAAPAEEHIVTVPMWVRTETVPAEGHTGTVLM